MFAVCDVAVHCRAGAAGGKGGEIDPSPALEVSPVGDLYVPEGARVSKFYNPIAPPAPGAFGVSPASPSNQNDITLHGIAAAGTTVRVYSGVGCVGSPVASGSAQEFRQGLAVHVDDNTTNQFTARVEFKGNQSDCTTAVTYVEDSSTSPPTIASTSPASPANDPSPRVFGNAETGSTIQVFVNARCEGAAAATGSVGDFSTAGFVVGVKPGDNTLYASAIDPAGNVSACSDGFPYTYTGSAVVPTGTTAPDTVITSGPGGPTWWRVSTFTYRSDRAGAKFQCRVDGAAWSNCDSGSYATAVLGQGAHHFEVAAIGAGNAVDPTPARRDFAINPPQTITFGCEVNPFLATGNIYPILGSPPKSENSCDVSYNSAVSYSHQSNLCGADPSQNFSICTTDANLFCPLGATCSVASVVEFRHDDTNAWWRAASTVDDSRRTCPARDCAKPTTGEGAARGRSRRSSSARTRRSASIAPAANAFRATTTSRTDPAPKVTATAPSASCRATTR